MIFCNHSNHNIRWSCIIYKLCENNIKYGKPFNSTLQSHEFCFNVNLYWRMFDCTSHCICTYFLIARIQTIWNTWECCECSNQFESSSKCTIVYAIGWYKLEYKSIYIYMTSYVRSNIIMKALWQLCQTPLYISEKIFIKWNWEDLPKFANTNKNIDFEHKIIENDVNEFFLTNLKKC